MRRTRMKFLAFNFCILAANLSLGARDCCPPDTALIPYSSTCSDNRTRYNLHCENGALLLDPAESEIDRFKLESNGSLIVFDGQQRAEDQFCIGKIRWNESWESPNSVALVCFGNDHDPEEWNFFASVLLRLLMILSILSLLFTIYIYAALPNLRDLQGKCVIAFICSLTISYTTLIVIQTFPKSSEEACIAQAAILYFFMTSCFFWNNVITFNIWKTIRKISFQVSEKTWTAIYFCWSFGIPFLMVILSFILENVPGGNHVRPHFAETKCWFKGKVESWSYFHGPISVLLLLNTIMFLQSSWSLWKCYRESTPSRIRSLRFQCFMYMKLFLLMGISWTFEVISYATNDISDYIKYLWFLTDCLNSAQGIFIFLILVVFRQKVRFGLLDKKLFGIRWPQSWANEEAQESSATLFGDDLELSNQKVKMIKGSRKEGDTA